MLKHWIHFKNETDRTKTLRKKQGKLVLDVHPYLNKKQVKTWLEGTFPLKVIGQNISNPIKKQKRRGKNIAYPVRHKTMTITIDRVDFKLQQKIRQSAKNELQFLKQIVTKDDFNEVILDWIQPNRNYKANIISKSLNSNIVDYTNAESTSITPYNG